MTPEEEDNILRRYREAVADGTINEIHRHYNDPETQRRIAQIRADAQVKLERLERYGGMVLYF
jgi:hypothetical protein